MLLGTFYTHITLWSIEKIMNRDNNRFELHLYCIDMHHILSTWLHISEPSGAAWIKLSLKCEDKQEPTEGGRTCVWLLSASQSFNQEQAATLRWPCQAITHISQLVGQHQWTKIRTSPTSQKTPSVLNQSHKWMCKIYSHTVGGVCVCVCVGGCYSGLTF